MYLFTFIPVLLLQASISDAKQRHQYRSYGPATTTTITVTDMVTETAGPTSTAWSFPLEAYTVVAARPDAPFHLFPMNADGFNFMLGGVPAIYCPNDSSACPAGNVTAFYGAGIMDVEVPGGQLVYVSPDGRLGYTQAHSASYLRGAVLAPFTYTKATNASYGYLGTYAFNASGLMACPATQSSYQVFAAISSITVPSGNISDCIGFSALAIGYRGNPVWQYI